MEQKVEAVVVLVRITGGTTHQVVLNENQSVAVRGMLADMFDPEDVPVSTAIDDNSLLDQD